VTEPVYVSPDQTVQIYHAEGFATLAELPRESFDAVITDPPYSSGGLTRSDRMQSPVAKYAQNDDAKGRPLFSGDNRDQRSWVTWSMLWLDRCRQLTRPGGYLHCFTDWRMLPAATDAVQAAGWVWRGIVPWDKGRGARAPHKGYHRHQAEYIVWGTNQHCAKATHAGPFDGVIAEPVRQADKHHLTGKPTPLMRRLVQVVPRGSRILDPFGGSGTTAVAAVMEGRRCVLIEQSAEYVEIAIARVERALKHRES